jgi:hypothetical protein
LCRLATGGGFSTRKLYTDDEEQLFNAQRPSILNGNGLPDARTDSGEQAEGRPSLAG